jgi:hypothetical protein
MIGTDHSCLLLARVSNQSQINIPILSTAGIELLKKDIYIYIYSNQICKKAIMVTTDLISFIASAGIFESG